MKTTLICPNSADGLSALGETAPLVTVPILGESFISYWFEHLAAHGVKEARLLCTDDRESFEEAREQAARWGVNLEIHEEAREISVEEARKRYDAPPETDPGSLQGTVIELNHLPGLREHRLFDSYADWFRGICFWLPHVTATQRLGMRELQPGVWASRRARISSSATLKAPCWVGDHARVGKNAVAGPFAFLEDRVVLDESCEVSQSWIGPDTFLGPLTQVEASLAWGSLLIDWQSGSHTEVPDSFLMCSLAEKTVKARQRSRRREAEAEISLARPIDAVISLAQKIQG